MFFKPLSLSIALKMMFSKNKDQNFYVFLFSFFGIILSTFILIFTFLFYLTLYNYTWSLIIGNFIGILLSFNLNNIILMYERLTGSNIMYGTGILSNINLNVNYIDLLIVSLFVFIIGLSTTYFVVLKSIKK